MEWVGGGGYGVVSEQRQRVEVWCRSNVVSEQQQETAERGVRTTLHGTDVGFTQQTLVSRNRQTEAEGATPHPAAAQTYSLRCLEALVS